MIQSIGIKETGMEKWECSICGHVYDPAEGDVDHGIAPGTAFEALPDSWFCPNCAVGKEFFAKVQYVYGG